MPGIAPLRPYQLEPAHAIIDSVLHHRGLTFTVEMARQSGKNELSAQLEATLLSTIAGCTNIKAAPTFTPQVKVSMRRLTDTLRAGRVSSHTDDGHIIIVGRSRQVFLSAEPTANVVGQTATHLLELDEAQDIDADKFDKDFRPMAAANNATTVLYGTPWSELDLLHRERQRALDLERHDGVHRAFLVPWSTPAATLPDYRAFVLAERDRLGPTHPAFTTQYQLTPMPSKGRLLTPQLLAQLAGEYPRRTTPPIGATIAAGLDIGGGSDDNPTAHDRTVLTLGAVTPPTPADPLPENHAAVLHHVAWQGLPHDQLIPSLIDILTTWRARSVTVDASGLGETTARLLTRRLPNATVTPLKFTRPSKSELGYGLLAAISTGRLKTYAPDDSDDARWYWHEAKLARADYLPGQAMNFYLDPSDGHDDYLISLALFQHAASTLQPRIARGRFAT